MGASHTFVEAKSLGRVLIESYYTHDYNEQVLKRIMTQKIEYITTL